MPRKRMIRVMLLAVMLSGVGPVLAAPLHEALELQGIGFAVNCDNVGSLNTVRIQPRGLQGNNALITKKVAGTATGAEVADLNADGSPEVFVYVTSVGSGSYGSLVAYAVNQKKSLSEIYLPPLTDNREASQGYMGHDEFAVVESRLARRFPVYRLGDTNGAPTGGSRQINYQLVAGEAGWVLKIVDWYEFDPDLDEAVVVEPLTR